jgi:hypothetical protein
MTQSTPEETGASWGSLRALRGFTISRLLQHYIYVNIWRMQMESTNPSFNPSGDERVAKIKALTEEIFKYLRENVPDNRCRSLAITNYEQAAMWAVKANFS